MVRVGILGGTFDPIHLGHLVAAEEVRWKLSLETVLFVPAANPPHKRGRAISPAADRVRMVEMAIGSNPFFELSTMEIGRGGVSYTVDTLRTLRERMGYEAELFFIVGMDSLADLTTWKQPATILSLCRLAVVNRPPYEEVDLASLEERLPGVSSRVDMVRMPGIYISSTDLQARVRRGLPIKYQVPDPVERYILDRGLYKR